MTHVFAVILYRVIKLNPKKATTAASPAERKLMQQLDAMKAMMEELKVSSAKPNQTNPLPFCFVCVLLLHPY